MHAMTIHGEDDFERPRSQGQVQKAELCNWTTVSNYYNVFILFVALLDANLPKTRAKRSVL